MASTCSGVVRVPHMLWYEQRTPQLVPIVTCTPGQCIEGPETLSRVPWGPVSEEREADHQLYLTGDPSLVGFVAHRDSIRV